MIPLINGDGLGLDFTLRYYPDHQNKVIKIEDRYGMFLPVPFHSWQYYIGQVYLPVIIRDFPELNPQLKMNKAVMMYCKRFEDCYIGLN